MLAAEDAKMSGPWPCPQGNIVEEWEASGFGPQIIVLFFLII